MKFNTEKHEEVHFGRKNMEDIYYLEDTSPAGGEEQRDLRLQIHQSLNIVPQVSKAIKKQANQRLGFISKVIQLKIGQLC